MNSMVKLGRFFNDFTHIAIAFTYYDFSFNESTHTTSSDLLPLLQENPGKQ